MRGLQLPEGGVKERLAAAAVAVSVILAGCSGPTGPSPAAVDFIVDVDGERFVVRTSDQETIRLADENRQGRNQRFPIGRLKPGDGGFNAPWTWHLDPATVDFVEAAIEVCDGRPSYVETHQADYPSYCPWGARVVGRR
jgi:hypothetical protein